MRCAWLAMVVSLCAACFSSKVPQRSYYVLHFANASERSVQPIRGLVRVRDMDAASIYEKFQIVVRRSLYELKYSEDHVWAVKPNRMVSDSLAQALAASGAFTSVSRELGELRPSFILSGDLDAIEIFDSDDLWFAHLTLSWSLSRLSTGEVLLTQTFDERKPIPARTFSQGARALSELLTLAAQQFIDALQRLDLERAAASEVQRQVVDVPPARDEAEPPGVILVPETPPDKGSTERDDSGAKKRPDRN